MEKIILRFLIGLCICIFVVGIALNVYVYFQEDVIVSKAKQQKCDKFKEQGLYELSFYYNQKTPIRTEAEADEFTNHANRAVQFFQLSNKCGGSTDEFKEALKFKYTADKTRQELKYSIGKLLNRFTEAQLKK